MKLILSKDFTGIRLHHLVQCNNIKIPGCWSRIRSFSTDPALSPVTVKRTSRLESARKFLNFAKPAKREMIIGIIFLPGALGAGMAFPLIIGKVIDIVSSSVKGDSDSITAAFSSDQVVTYGALLLSLSVFGAATTFGRSYFINLSSEIIVRHMRKDLFQHLISKKPIAFFDTAKTGDLVNRLSADSTLISSFLSESVSMGLRGVGTLGFGLGFLIYTSPTLAAVSVASLLPLVIFGRYFGNLMKVQTNEQLKEFGESSALAEESFGFAKVIHMFNQEKYQTKLYDNQLEKVYSLGRDLCWTRAKFFGVTELIMNASMMSVIATGSYLVFANELSPGELASFLMYALYVAGANFQITAVFSSAMKAIGALQRIDEIFIDTELPNSKLFAENLSGVKLFAESKNSKICLEFKNVTFSYPSRPQDMILNDLSLKIPAGKSVAIVGHSGSGKSTLFSLLTRLYYPNSGSIEISDCSDDGSKRVLPLNDVDLMDLRENLGVVSQEPVIFMTSVAENIRFGKSSATIEQVIEAAKQANIHQFIESLPNGYDSLVGQRGSQLSGGQKQRLCIARAILKDPKILLLDEATSSLDVHNEALVQSALERLMPGRTSIVVAHRLSTIRNVDYIAVLEAGKVVQFGPRFEVMLDPKGKFNEFLKRDKYD